MRPIDIQNRVEKIQKMLEHYSQQHRTGHFAALGAEELTASLLTENQALTILWQGGPGDAPLPQGSSFVFTLGLHNPGLSPIGYTFAHLWTGRGHADPNISTFLLNVDQRFPTLTEPQTQQGLTIGPDEIKTLDFTVTIPTGVEKTLYTLNTCIMRAHWHGVGEFLARSSFPFLVG